jgi:hypothetical protein
MSDADDRFSAISGGLKRRRPISAVPDPDPEPTPPTPEPALPVDETAPAVPTTPVISKEASSASPRRTTPSADDTSENTPVSASTGGNRRVAFRVPESTDQLLRDRVRADASSKVHVILDSIEHMVESATPLTFEEPSKNKSSLFVRPRTPTSAMPTVQTEIILDAGSLATIDHLAEQHGAPTRTAFVLACLDAYL